MADFDLAFETTMKNEGGYLLHQVGNDRGGMTFAGISRKFWPDWPGWVFLDRGEWAEELEPMAKQFYRENFWQKIRGDEIRSQAVADSIYDFAVNSGVGTAVKVAQRILGIKDDGLVGRQTLNAITLWADPDKFLLRYALAKIDRYADICSHDPGQKQFLLGWVNRSLAGVRL
jgi:lysozyme family protein